MGSEDRQGFEKRASKRIKQPFTAKLQIISGEMSAGWDIIQLRDLSSGGALFNYHQELKPGASINLSVTVPMLKDPVVCVAKVVRTKRLEGRSIYETAVSFTTINDSARALINNAASAFFSKNP